MKLNLEVWNSKRLEVEAKIKAIKASLHTPGHYGTWKEWGDLRALKRMATTLYMLRAELKNRLHCKTFVRYINRPDNKQVKETLVCTREEQADRIRIDQKALDGVLRGCLEPVPTQAPSLQAAV